MGLAGMNPGRRSCLLFPNYLCFHQSSVIFGYYYCVLMTQRILWQVWCETPIGHYLIEFLLISVVVAWPVVWPLEAICILSSLHIGTQFLKHCVERLRRKCQVIDDSLAAGKLCHVNTDWLMTMRTCKVSFSGDWVMNSKIDGTKLEK